MVRHIVMFRLRADEEAARDAAAAGIQQRLESLRDLDGVEGIGVHRDLGVVPGHWDVVLVADYASHEALEAYQVHPRHREAVEWIDGVVSARAVVDFQL